MCLMQSGILHCRCRRNGIKQAGRAAAQKATSLHYAKIACPLTHTECLTTVMPTIITAVNINLHPASSGNITAIIHSYDRDNSAREGSKDRASYFLAAYNMIPYTVYHYIYIYLIIAFCINVLNDKDCPVGLSSNGLLQ